MTTAQANAISLQGWDTANVTSFDVINAAIAKQNKTPDAFSFVSGDPVAVPSISGNWDNWKVIPGGAGKTLRMSFPIKSGAAIVTTPELTNIKFDKATAGAALMLDSSGLVITNTASAGTAQSVIGEVGRDNGKYYFEVTFGTLANLAIVGVAPAGLPAGQAFASGSAGAYGYQSDGQAISNGSPGAFPAGNGLTFKAGDTVGVAVDIDAGKLWFRGPDGKWQGAANADPVTGVGETFSFTAKSKMFPAIAVGAGAVATANLLEMVHKFPPPGGFTSFKNAMSSLDLAGCSITGEIGLKKVPAPTSGTNLVADSTSTVSMPAVVLKAFVTPAGSKITTSQGKLADLAFETILNGAISNFSNIFHKVDAATPLATGNLAWLNPTESEYAVADLPMTPGTATSAFALLSMTEQRSAANNSAQIDPTILANLPTGANSVFVLSGSLLTSKILLNAATAVLVGSKTTDFDIDSSGLVITNKTELPWREVTLDDGSKVTPQVPVGGLKIRVNGRHIEFEFTGVHFDVPGWPWPGHKIATLNFLQKIYLALEPRTDGKHVLVAKNVDPASTDAAAIKADLPTVENACTVVSFDQSAITFQAAMDVVSIVLSVITLGLAAFSAGAWVISSKSVAAAAATAANNGTGMINLAGHIYEDVGAVLNAAGQAGQDAGCLALLRGGGVAGGQMLFVTKVAIGLTFVGVICGIGTGVSWWVAVSAHQNAQDLAKGDVDKVPLAMTIQAFLDKGLQPFEWTGTANAWTPVAASLNGNLLIYGNLA